MIETIHPSAECQGKDKFKTREMANRVATARRKFSNRKFDCYKCRVCQHWHIGSSHVKHRMKKKK